MTEQTRYVMGIYELSAMIRDTLEYCFPAPQDGYSLNAYNQRKTMVKHLLEENSPFVLFCKRNEAPTKDDPNVKIGDRILTQLNEFVDDVYGDESRIVKINHDKVVVESSLMIQLLDYVIGLHETISDICRGYEATFRKEGTLESDFEELLKTDDPYYRAVAFRAVAVSFNNKFIEYNNAVRTYVSQERENTGVDPRTKPGFDPKVDPSCAFINNELGRLMGFFNFLVRHNKSEDVVFTDAIKKMTGYFDYFSGKRQLQNGQKMNDVMREFDAVFIPLINPYRDAWLRIFNKVFNDLREYEANLIKRQQQEAAQAPAEENKEETK